MAQSVVRSIRAAILAMLAIVTLWAAPAVAQDGEIDLEQMASELEQYGHWREHARYGEVWVPDVDADWRPYTRGSWAHTEEHGWLWESEEPFGWIVYHYGRWHRDEDDGWVWVPGTEWGPAWVAWRHNDDEVGWAPLPPEADWRDGEISYSSALFDSPRFQPAWCFVPVALLTAPRIWSHVVSPRRNSYYLSRTRFVPFDRGRGHGFYNHGFDRHRWERVTGRSIVSRRIVTIDRPLRDRPRFERGGDVQVYRPRVIGLPRPDGRPGFDRRDDWRDRGGDRGRDGGRTRDRDRDWSRERDAGRDRDWGRDRDRDGRPPQRPSVYPTDPRRTEPGVTVRDPSPRDRDLGRGVDRPGRDRDDRDGRPGRTFDRPTVSPGVTPVQPRDPGERRTGETRVDRPATPPSPREPKVERRQDGVSGGGKPAPSPEVRGRDGGGREGGGREGGGREGGGRGERGQRDGQPIQGQVPSR